MIEVNENIVEFSLGSLVGLLGWFFGGLDGFVKVLITLMVVDYITGILAAGVERKISSSIGFKGILRKIGMFSLVGVAHVLDDLLGDSQAFKAAVCLFYISNEGVSILENIDRLGIPIPKFLKDRFLQLRNDKEEGQNAMKT